MIYIIDIDNLCIYTYFSICRIMQMTLIHDLAECIVGDITPYCGIPPDEKHRMEDEAMEDICKLLGDKGPEILQIFRVRIFSCNSDFSILTFINIY